MKLKKILSFFLSLILITASVNTALPEKASAANTRQTENLDRGLVAMKTSGGIYLSWRLMSDEDCYLGTASSNVSFNIYRDGTLIATESKTTNYTDASGTAASIYQVAPVANGVEGTKSASVTAFSSGSNYFDIPLDFPSAYTAPDGTSYTYSPGDTSCGDLDGDGEYELVVKWDCNPQDNSNSGYTGNVLLDAYKLNGTKLWRIDLGKNIRSGAHYTQFLVYDFDLDGKAEVTCKTAPGSKDGAGNYVTLASSDSSINTADNTSSYVNDGGYIITGPEYFTIFNGQTGAAIDTINYPVQRVSAASWGDAYGNRCDRFIADVAWLDGKKPYAVYWRGYYFPQSGYSGRTGVCGISFDGKKLSADYIWDTLSTQSGYTAGNESYIGQGNHNMTVADVDGDGKDEFISGSLCFEVNDSDKLVPKWCSWREHGDALHIGDYDPTHDGYEYFSVHEDGATDGSVTSNGKTLDFGMTVYDAKTGEELKHVAGSKDTGRGIMANVGAGGYYQFWGASGAGTYKALGNNVFESTSISGASYNFRIFWNGDLYDDLLDGTGISAWNGSSMSSIFTATGCTSVNGSKANPALQADLFGDWREEVVYPLTDGSALRVFTTNISTNYKMKTLMHDSVYRSGVAAEQSAYNQPPHIGFYVSSETFYGTATNLKLTSLPSKTTYNVGEDLDLTGLVVSVSYENGLTTQISSYSASGYDAYATGEQTITITYKNLSTTFTVNVVSGFSVNASGLITSYNNTSQTEVILPKTIGSVTVTGFADSSMLNTNITKMYIYQDSLTFGKNVFDKSITLVCYEGSTAHEYAVANGISYELITEKDVQTVSFEGDFYKGYVDAAMLTQAKSASLADSYVTYTTVAAGGPYASTGSSYGFFIKQSNANTYLKVVPAVTTSTQRTYITINNPTVLADVGEASFYMDLFFPSNSGTPYIDVADNSSTIEAISQSSLGLSSDTWYTYKLKYSGGKYSRTVYNADGSVFSAEVSLSASPGTYGVSKINLRQNYGGSASTCCYIDNLTMESVTNNTVQFIVANSSGYKLEGAKIVIGGQTAYTNSNGMASFTVASGRYAAVVSLDGYTAQEINVSARNEFNTVSVVLEKATINATSVCLDRDSVKLRVGDYETLKQTVLPKTASQTVSWASSNPEVADVDKNGVICAKSTGSAVIVAKTGDLSAQCVVTVIAGDYTQTPTSVSIYGESTVSGNIWKAVSLPNQKAEVYDQNGVKIYNSSITWSLVSGDASITSVDDIVYGTIKKGFNGTLVLKASSGSISGTKNITVSSCDNTTKYIDLTFSETGYSSLSFVQGTTEQTQTIGNVTYGVGARSSGGDGYSGFATASSSGNTYLLAKAGRFSSSNRNAYLTINNAPALASVSVCIFETDMYFEASDYDMTVTIGDGTTTIASFTPTSKTLSKGAWYHYKLEYTNGSFTEYIEDMTTGAVTCATYTSSAAKIAKMTFTSTASCALRLDNMKLFSTDNVYMTAYINVIDKDGNPISGATVSGGLSDAVTGESGTAAVTCYYGGNTFAVKSDSYGESVLCENISTQNQSVTVVLKRPKTTVLYSDSDKAIICSDYDSSLYKTVKLFYAYYNAAGQLVAVEEKSKNIYGGKTSETLTLPAFEGASKVKIMMWDSTDNMLPVMTVITKQ
ncbi:MAG: bacterial Ig-like domain-containing protein [Clostridia bacterium]|nr:bacterial Ig-like domain-containing protein [Clostridia bacterium]